jgi:hypothetical protein
MSLKSIGDILWCLFNKNYKNWEERRSALQELGEKYSLDSKLILNKVKSLRWYFHREHSKALKKKSGSSTDEIYRSSWFAYKHMLFILQGDGARKGKDTRTTLEESLVSICIWSFLSLSYIACITDIYLATIRILHST